MHSAAHLRDRVEDAKPHLALLQLPWLEVSRIEAFVHHEHKIPSRPDSHTENHPNDGPILCQSTLYMCMYMYMYMYMYM